MLGLLLIVLGLSGNDALFSYPVEARDATLGEFPWIAYVNASNRAFLISCTIVSRFYVVTACKRAGMFTARPPPEYLYSNMRVVAGSILKDTFVNQGSQIRWIYYWEDHPKCRIGGATGYYSYDASIIKVTQQFIFNELVSPMPFIRDQKEMRKKVDDIIAKQVNCSIAGWGASRYLNINFSSIRNGQPKYTPDINAFQGCDTCTPKSLKVINMTVMDDEACRKADLVGRFWQNFVYRRHPPEDTLCVLGIGTYGDAFHSKRSGMVCAGDTAAPMVCNTPDGPLVIGQSSYLGLCTIDWMDFPSVITRFDWGLHPWLNQFYSPSMFDKHWVDPVYPDSKEYCKGYTYCGPLPRG